MKERIKLVLTVCIMPIFVFLFVNSADADFAKTVKFDGKTYLNYKYDATDGAEDKDEFEVARAYFGAKGELAENVKFKVTMDVTREKKYNEADVTTGDLSSEDYYYDVYLKYAYFEIIDVIGSSNFVLGLAATPWVGYVEKAWKYRFVQKVLSDAEGKLSSADLGVSLNGSITDYLTYQLSIINGEGYKNPEENKYKNGHLRLSYYPAPNSNALEGLSISAHYMYGFEDKDDEENRYGALVHYSYDPINVGFEYLASVDDDATGSNEVDGAGWSLFGEYAFLERYGIFARYDSWDPNTDSDSDDDSHTLLIAGLSAKVAKPLTMAVDMQTKDYEDGNEEDENIYYLHTELKF